jgi:DNA-binding NtrC family response regulator
MTEPESNARKAKTKLMVDQNGTQVTLKRMAKDAIKEVERNVILETLRANQWNRRKTAQDLKISYRALIYKIQDAGLVARRGSARNDELPTGVHDGSDD